MCYKVSSLTRWREYKILKWGKERNGNFLDEDILEGLQPHHNVESLTIEEFKGTKFASWMMRNCRVTNLRHLRTRSCQQLLSLCCGLEYCPSLETVEIEDCDNLESFQISPSQSLQVLRIKNCPKLRCTSIQSLPSLHNLVIKWCTTLEGDLSLNGCTSLRELTIEGCHGFTSILSGLHSCTSLRKLEIGSSRNLRTLSGHGLQTPVSLETITIQDCHNLEAIPSLDNLTSLTGLNIGACNGLISLPSGLASCTSLTHLSVCTCHNLEAIPSLDNLTSLTELVIFNCDGLTSIGLAYCTSLTLLDVSRCCNLEAIPSLDNLTSLNVLSVCLCNNLISLADHNVSSLQSLSSLELSYCRKLQYLPKGLHSLSRLERLKIGPFYEELDSFPDFQVPSKLQELRLKGWPKLKSLPQQIQHSASLTYLWIHGFDGLEALPEWLGNLTSLAELGMRECENLMYLPTVEAMQRLTNLHDLGIYLCPRLSERCAKDSGPEWPKISHIPFRM